MGLYYEEIGVGDEYRTRSRTVFEADVHSFTNLVGVHEPLFKNREYFEDTRFEGLITPGPFVFALSAAAVLSEGFVEETVIAFLGLEEMRIENPVTPDDTITSHVQIAEKRPTSDPDSGIVTFDVTVTNQDDETVMTYTGTFLVERSPAAEANDSSADI